VCRVLISGFYGFDNAGDEAILQSMVNELRTSNESVDIIVLSANPYYTAKKFNVEAVNRSNIFDIYKSVKSCDVFISGGGSLFQDTTSVYSVWYYSGVIMLAYLLKKPVFAFAQGIGPVCRNFNIKILRHVMNKTVGISVRDRRSMNELKRIGVNKDIYCTTDPAFLLESCPKERAEAILKKENGGMELKRPKVGFSIRKWKGNVDVVSVISTVADRVSRELDADVVFFPLHYTNDLELAHEIADKMQESALVIDGQYSSEELMGLYGQMGLNVSVRFHGLVFSIANAVPVIAISYDPKIDSLMESIGMSSVSTYRELNSENIFKEVKKQWNRKEDTSKLLTVKSQELKAIAKNGMGQITKWIFGSKEKISV